MNLNFSVAVYRGAAQAGLVPDITLSSVKNGLDVDSDPGFIECVDIWRKFWSSPYEDFCTKLSSGDSNKDQAIDTLYDEIWAAHALVIDVSLPYAKRFKGFMSTSERKFGLGWCRMVELLSNMSWTSLSLHAMM